MTQALYEEYRAWMASPVYPTVLGRPGPGLGLEPMSVGSALMSFKDRVQTREIQDYADECKRLGRLTSKYPAPKSAFNDLITGLFMDITPAHNLLRSGNGDEAAFRACVLGVRRVRDVIACHWSRIRPPDETDMPDIGFPPSFIP